MGVSKDDILAVLREHPEVIVEALERRTDLLLALLARLVPWDRLATKEDIRLIIEFIEKRFGDVNKRFEDINKRFEDMNKRFEDINRRFEDINRRFEDINRRFEDVNKRFEDINRRFEDINKRFEDFRYYVDRRFAIVERLVLSFNVPIIIMLIMLVFRVFLAP